METIKVSFEKLEIVTCLKLTMSKMRRLKEKQLEICRFLKKDWKSYSKRGILFKAKGHVW